MLRAALLVVQLVVAADAAMAHDGAQGPERWIRLEERRNDDVPFRAPPPSDDPVTRLIEHCKRNPIGVRPVFTLLPSEHNAGQVGVLPTFALFARAHGRTLVSLTRVHARADAGQDVVMQRTLVSDLLAGKQFSLTVYEDHVLGETATKMLGFGTRMTFRPAFEVAGWRLRLEALASYGVDDGVAGYLAITGALHAPAVPVAVGR
jgi:hypothetical protein